MRNEKKKAFHLILLIIYHKYKVMKVDIKPMFSCM